MCKTIGPAFAYDGSHAFLNQVPKHTWAGGEDLLALAKMLIPTGCLEQKPGEPLERQAVEVSWHTICLLILHLRSQPPNNRMRFPTESSSSIPTSRKKIKLDFRLTTSHFSLVLTVCAYGNLD